MNGQHFKELFNSLCITMGCTKKSLAEYLGTTYGTVYSWEQKGVPISIKPYVISVLRQALLNHMHQKAKTCV